MKKQFVTYEISQKLRELGFNVECCGIYNPMFLFDGCWTTTNSQIESYNPKTKVVCAAPLWQQVADWLREKHKISIDFHSTFRDSKIRGGIYGLFVVNDYKNNIQDQTIESLDINSVREAAILKALNLIK